MKITPIALAVLLGSSVGFAQQTAPTPAPGAPPTAAPDQAGRGQGGRGGGRGAAAAPRVIQIPNAPDLGYRAVANSLPLPEGQKYGQISAVAVNSQGHVFVYQRTAQPLVEFDAQGRFIRYMREGTQVRTHGLQIDKDDNIWLTDAGENTVTKINPRGETLMTIGTKGVAGTGDEGAAKGLLNVPSDVAFGPNGDIFIAQGEGGGPDPRLIRYSNDGRFISSLSLAYATGLRSNPHTIATDRNGLVYVGDRELMRIRIFQPNGTHVRDIQLQQQVCGLYIDPSDQIWVATGSDGQVMTIDRDGKVLAFTGKIGTGPGEFTEAHLITGAPNGDIYVTDTAAMQVEKFVKP